MILVYQSAVSIELGQDWTEINCYDEVDLLKNLGQFLLECDDIGAVWLVMFFTMDQKAKENPSFLITPSRIDALMYAKHILFNPETANKRRVITEVSAIQCASYARAIDIIEVGAQYSSKRT